MKIKELLEKTILPKVGNDNFTKAFNSENFLEAELNEESVNDIESTFNSFLTKEAALNNPEIVKEINDKNSMSLKNSIYSSIEGHVSKVAANAGVSFEEGDKMLQKLEKLANSDFNGKESEKIKRLNEDYTKLQGDFSAYKSKVQEEADLKEREFERKQLEQSQKNFLSTNYQLSDAFKDDSDIVHEKVMREVNKKAFLKLGENGIDVRDPNNNELQLFENNKSVDYKSLVDPIMSRYLKKSDPILQNSGTPRLAQSENLSEMQKHLIKQRAR